MERSRCAMESSPATRPVHCLHIQRETEWSCSKCNLNTELCGSLIWNLLLVGKTSIERILKSHYCAIAHINWHTTECNTVASPVWILGYTRGTCKNLNGRYLA
ncbi:hypothetical protein P691DRAFT_519131 [Macrolepiota fuliginosa MF-IS2]|uniref:Uncharacterized protein n=1 Tax=Macrolepiota fuliginosa MF-IS2 TaxID=1400762 RepID=A0A9P5X233_9AGAR|nr:hypothetical protein P691DRAFT_519131 [Macrolepiota fuliginosa MF-IS2]